MKNQSLKQHIRPGLQTMLMLAAITVSSQAWALKNDTQQPIYIDSDSQTLDMKKNTVVFAGNVTLKQGSIRVSANKVIVERDSNSNDLKTIEGYGSPAKFSQKTDEGKMLRGQARRLTYTLASDQLVMTTDAKLSQDDSVITGTRIVYKISSQNLIANGSKGERVTTVLQPSQLQKNSEQQKEEQEEK